MTTGYIAVVVGGLTVLVNLIAVFKFFKKNKQEEYNKGKRDGENESVLKSIETTSKETNAEVKEINKKMQSHSEELRQINSTLQEHSNTMRDHEERLRNVEKKGCNLIG